MAFDIAVILFTGGQKGGAMVSYRIITIFFFSNDSELLVVGPDIFLAILFGGSYWFLNLKLLEHVVGITQLVLTMTFIRRLRSYVDQLIFRQVLQLRSANWLSFHCSQVGLTLLVDLGLHGSVEHSIFILLPYSVCFLNVHGFILNYNQAIDSSAFFAGLAMMSKS